MRLPFGLLLLLVLLCSAAHARSVYLTVVGIPGEDDYRIRFEGWARQINGGLSKAPGSPLVKLVGAQGGATRKELEDAIQEAARTAGPQDTFTLILIGHGTYDGRDYKFNLKGPDISATQLAVLLDRIPAERQLIVNTTSCSGGSIPALVKPKRIVVAATRSGTQKNATIFGRYFADAFTDVDADNDKNQVVSALEAFQYAQRRTVEYFEQEKRIATENAVLNDIGSGAGVRDPGSDNGQGLLASSFPMLRLGEGSEAAAPGKAGLSQRKEELELQIDRLKYERQTMSPADYRQRMNALLLMLARTQAEIDK
jgi:hypothetical protein